jgi:hypothetical protein
MTLSDIAGIVGASILTVSTAGGIVVALSGWLGKVWAARILENERVALQRELEAFRAQSGRVLEQHKYSLGKFSLVHKLQFEKEFRVYEDLWAQIVELRGAAMSLRPMIDYGGDSTKDEEIKRRLKLVSDAFETCRKTVLTNQPFYHAPVYELANDLLSATRREAFDYQRGREGRWAEYYEIAQKNADQIVGLANRICDIIRERISSLEVPVVTEIA